MRNEEFSQAEGPDQKAAALAELAHRRMWVHAKQGLTTSYYEKEPDSIRSRLICVRVRLGCMQIFRYV
jgi:hypothetical protein